MRSTTNIHYDPDDVITAEVNPTKQGGHYVTFEGESYGGVTLFITLDQMETMCDSLVGSLTAARHAEHLANQEPIPFLPTSLVDEQPSPFVPLREYGTGDDAA